MTALVSIDTRVGMVRRYVRNVFSGVRTKTHEILPDPATLAAYRDGRLDLATPESVERFRCFGGSRGACA